MDKRAFLSNLDKLGMTQAQFARLLQIDPNTVGRWRKIPGYASAYITLALSISEAWREIGKEKRR